MAEAANLSVSITGDASGLINASAKTQKLISPQLTIPQTV